MLCHGAFVAILSDDFTIAWTIVFLPNFPCFWQWLHYFDRRAHQNIKVLHNCVIHYQLPLSSFHIGQKEKQLLQN